MGMVVHQAIIFCKLKSKFFQYLSHILVPLLVSPSQLVQKNTFEACTTLFNDIIHKETLNTSNHENVITTHTHTNLTNLSTSCTSPVDLFPFFSIIRVLKLHTQRFCFFNKSSLSHSFTTPTCLTFNSSRQIIHSNIITFLLLFPLHCILTCFSVFSPIQHAHRPFHASPYHFR